MSRSFRSASQPAAAQSPETSASGVYEDFLSRFTLAQGRIQAYVRSLVHDRAAADDVFQATSLELWRRFSSFQQDGDFTGWALGVARNKVLHHWRSSRRDRHVFADEVLTHLADIAIDVIEEADDRQEALVACLESLPARQRQLVSLFYGERLSAGDIAAQWNRSVHAVYKALRVLRHSLLMCIEGRLAEPKPSRF